MESIKCAIIGDGGVGKKSLLISYSTKAIPGDFKHTIFDKCSNLMFNGRSISLGIWDSLGQKDEENLRPFCFPNTDVVLICFSVVQPDSFENVREKWLAEIFQHCPESTIILVGTKSDLRTDDQTLKDLMDRRLSPISERQGELMANEIKAVKYIECSTLTETGIKQVFDEVIRSANCSKDSQKKSEKKLLRCCPM